jgi:hypothetical protein
VPTVAPCKEFQPSEGALARASAGGANQPGSVNAGGASAAGGGSGSAVGGGLAAALGVVLLVGGLAVRRLRSARLRAGATSSQVELAASRAHMRGFDMGQEEEEEEEGGDGEQDDEADVEDV